MCVDRFFAMGTRVEVHLFGTDDERGLAAARSAIEAVDDALTIHRPSPATAANEQLMAGRSARIEHPLLAIALAEIERANAATFGLFDPAHDARFGPGGWKSLSFDAEEGVIETSRPIALDFGGFGKGFALDHACGHLRKAGVTSAFLSAGESSIAVIGEHPLGGGWPISVPHPLDPGRTLIELELDDESLSISSTMTAGPGSPERAALVRPLDSSPVAAARLSLSVERSGARAEAMSTALLVANADEAARLLEEPNVRRFRFDFAPRNASPVHLARMRVQ